MIAFCLNWPYWPYQYKNSKRVNITTKLNRHVTTQSFKSVYYALVYPYLNYSCILCGNNYEAPLSQSAKLQNKVVRVINNVPLCDFIIPHYLTFGLITLYDIVNLNTCQLFYDYFVDTKVSNFTLALVSEQHNYDTRTASLQHLNPRSFRINIRKFMKGVSWRRDMIVWCPFELKSTICNYAYQPSKYTRLTRIIELRVFYTKYKTLEIKAEILELKLSINPLTLRWDALEKPQDFISMKYDTLIETIQQSNV